MTTPTPLDLSAYEGHTDGEWAIFPRFHTQYIVPAAHLSRKIGAHVDAAIDLCDYAQTIVYVEPNHRHRSPVEQRANARLIADAPKLLQRARDLERECGRLRAIVVELVAVADLRAEVSKQVRLTGHAAASAMDAYRRREDALVAAARTELETK